MTTPWRVGAIGKGLLPWCIPLPDSSRVTDLTRAVEARQNKLCQEGKNEPKIAVGIRLRVGGELYAVDPDDLLLNLIPPGGQGGARFVATRAGSGSASDTPDAAASAPWRKNKLTVPAAASSTKRRKVSAVQSRKESRPSKGTPSSKRTSSGSGNRSGSSSSKIRPGRGRNRTKSCTSKSSGGSGSSGIGGIGGIGGSSSRTAKSCLIGDTKPCAVCYGPLNIAHRPSFCCRTCHKLFHSACVGYDPRKRQCPPPDWVCPRCPNGERGPSVSCLHPSLRGKGAVTQERGNQPWCPICLDDNRAPGMFTMGSGSKRCPGCGFHAHAHCREELEVTPDGRWPCDECQRRPGGVVPGDNPLWLRLKEARLSGGFKITSTPLPSSGACITPATAGDDDSLDFLGWTSASPDSTEPPPASPVGPPSIRDEKEDTAAVAAAAVAAAEEEEEEEAAVAAAEEEEEEEEEAEEAAAATTTTTTAPAAPAEVTATEITAAGAASFLPAQCLHRFSPSLAPSAAIMATPTTAVPPPPPPSSAFPSPSAAASAATVAAAAAATAAAAAARLPSRGAEEGISAKESSLPAALPPPSPASATATTIAPTIMTGPESRGGDDSVKDAADMDNTPRRYPKRTKMATTPDASQARGRAEFRHELDWQTAENTVLASIMLHGTPEEQNSARVLISTVLNKTTTEACDALVEKLKDAVDKDDEGTWVHRTKLVDLCSSDEDLATYVIGRPTTQDMFKRVASKFKVLANLASRPGSRCQLESHDEDIEQGRYFALRE